jgi:hypothetical protein
VKEGKMTADDRDNTRNIGQTVLNVKTTLGCGEIAGAGTGPIEVVREKAYSKMSVSDFSQQRLFFKAVA